MKKGHTVWGIYSNNASQRELEDFIAHNPYIESRGVTRDVNGRITHLEIRAGEKILVPNKIAELYKSGYSNGVSFGPSYHNKDKLFGAGLSRLGSCYNLDIIQPLSYSESQWISVNGHNGDNGYNGDNRQVSDQLSDQVSDKYDVFIKSASEVLGIDKNDPAGNDYITDKYQQYQKKGKVPLSKTGLFFHKVGYYIDKFNNDNPGTSGVIRGFVDSTGKVVGVVVDGVAYTLNPLKPMWELYRDSVNEYLVPNIVQQWINDQGYKIEKGWKDWLSELTTKQKILLDTSVEAIDFGSNVFIIAGAAKTAGKLAEQTITIELGGKLHYTELTAKDSAKKITKKNKTRNKK